MRIISTRASFGSSFDSSFINCDGNREFENLKHAFAEIWFLGQRCLEPGTRARPLDRLGFALIARGGRIIRRQERDADDLRSRLR